MEKKIGDRTFRVDNMAASEAVGYLFRVGKIAAPIVSGLKGVKLASLMGPEGNDGRTLEVIAGFLAQLDPVEGQKLVMELCGKAEIMNAQNVYEPVVFDIHFAKNVLDSFQVAAMVVQVNFGDFFGGKLPGK